MNLFKNLPVDSSQEDFQDIVKSNNVRIERIVSFGQSSPETGWYDQDEHEWVCVLEGFGEIEYDSGECFRLEKGDTLLIARHQKHRVIATAQDSETIWLAVFFTE